VINIKDDIIYKYDNGSKKKNVPNLAISFLDISRLRRDEIVNSIAHRIKPMLKSAG